MIEELLKIACDEAKEGVNNKEGGPFGAVITDLNGNIISSGHNMVLKTNDPTNHAEIVAIRKACSKLNTHDLSNCIIYCSCEPCPMCLSAIIWSNIKTVYYGSSRKEAALKGFRDDLIYDFLQGKKTIININNCNNKLCIDTMKNYEGEIY